MHRAALYCDVMATQRRALPIPLNNHPARLAMICEIGSSKCVIVPPWPHCTTGNASHRMPRAASEGRVARLLCPCRYHTPAPFHGRAYSPSGRQFPGVSLAPFASCPRFCNQPVEGVLPLAPCWAEKQACFSDLIAVSVSA
jgi:hypothetical protein